MFRRNPRTRNISTKLIPTSEKHIKAAKPKPTIKVKGNTAKFSNR